MRRAQGTLSAAQQMYGHLFAVEGASDLPAHVAKVSKINGLREGHLVRVTHLLPETPAKDEIAARLSSTHTTVST